MNIDETIQKINALPFTRHPGYVNMQSKWTKYRYTFEGGSDFVNKYLKRFSNRETAEDFNSRKTYSYCPAHVKSELYKVKNAIYQRLSDIVRLGGAPTYKATIDGLNGGVDHQGSSLTNFIGEEILPELLALGKVGIYVDRPVLPEFVSRREVSEFAPYLYTYKAESIINWAYDNDNNLASVVLQDENYEYDENINVPIKTVTSYRSLKRLGRDEGVELVFYNGSGEETSSVILDLEYIPFIILELPESILTDVADYQIALLNLGSSDINYALRSNFPFYVEQFDIQLALQNIIQGGPAYDSDGNAYTPGSEAEAKANKSQEIALGNGQGRRYPKGTERPAYIHPSPEPLEVSMQKQATLRQEIKELMQMNLEKLDKEQNKGTVDSGLAFIGAVLEQGEREIARIWSDYEKVENTTYVKYPRNYTLRSEEDRLKEAEAIEQQIAKTPSTTLKKELAKQVADILIGHKISKDTLEKINNEIDSAKVIVIDPTVIREDHEAGFVGTQLASELRGYPEGEVEKAKQDHADRAIRIAAAQSSVGLDKVTFRNGEISTDMNDNVGAARGIDDLDANPLQAAREEKKESQDTTLSDTTKKRTRGEAKG